MNPLWWWTPSKTWKVSPVKNVNFNLLPFKRCPYENDFCPINLGDLNIILGSWNGFTANFRESYEGLFFLNYDFWKCGFWSRGWGLRALFVSTGLWQHLRLKKLNLVHFFSRYYLFRFIWYWTGSKPSPSLLSPFSFFVFRVFFCGSCNFEFFWLFCYCLRGFLVNF